MNKVIKRLIELLIILLTVIICSLVAVFIMTLSFMVPMNRTNLDASVNLGNQEGYYVDALEHIPSFEKYFIQFQPGTMTVADDVRGFHIAEDHEGFNALENALYCNDYPRYWHGYAMIMRILFHFFDYKEMRFINFLFQSFLVICIFLLLREKGEKKISWMALIWYVLMMPISVACCLVYGCTVDAIFVLTIFVMLRGDKIWNDDSKLSIVFTVIGCVVCFFDLLIFSPMGWAMPLAMLVILCGNRYTPVQNICKTIRSAISWFLGYALFWLLKMAYAQIVVGDKCSTNVFLGALYEAIWSAAKKNPEDVGFLSKIAERWSAVKTNYTHYTYTVYAIIILCMTMIAVVVFIRKGIKIQHESRLLPLLIVTSSPVIWVFTINTATKAHHIFDYRLMSTEIVCAVIIILLSMDSNTVKPDAKVLLKRLSISAVFLAVGVLFASLIRESQYSMNADKPGMQEVIVGENDNVSMDFHPAFGTVSELGLSVTPGSDKGEMRITLLQAGVTVNEISVPIRDFYETGWQMINVDWSVSPRKNYEICIQLKNTDAPVTITTLPYSVIGAISELGNVTVNSDILDCQIVTWVNYIRRPSYKNVITYGAIIAMYLSAFTLAVCSMITAKKQKTGAI